MQEALSQNGSPGGGRAKWKCRQKEPKGEQTSGAIIQRRKRMLIIREEGNSFTRKEKSKQNEEKCEQKSML